MPQRVVASSLSLQTYEGKPALAWWQGVVTNTGATESGEDVVVNQHYQTVATLKGKDGWKLTLHEFLIRGDDAWVTANKDIPMNLSKYGGAYNGALTDSAVQEYNLKTGKLLFNWDALAADHIPLGDSYATLPTNGFPWDAYHVNSIDLLGNGTFLVSMRDTWAAYLVNIKTGKIEWTLGGRHSSYRFGPRAAFQWQHDVRLQPGGVVTMFDLCPGDRLFARAHPQARPADAHGDARASVRDEFRSLLRLHGRHTAAGERQRDGRLGIIALSDRVQPVGNGVAGRGVTGL